MPERKPFARVILGNDEIEVACDALWSAKSFGFHDEVQARLWRRLRPVRSGDLGGSATIDLEPEEQAAVARALRSCMERVDLDEHEEELLGRVS